MFVISGFGLLFCYGSAFLGWQLNTRSIYIYIIYIQPSFVHWYFLSHSLYSIYLYYHGILSLLFSSLFYSVFWINRINHRPITAPHSLRPTIPLHYSQSGTTTDILTNHHCYSTLLSTTEYYSTATTQSTRMDGWNENVALSSSVQRLLLFPSRNCGFTHHPLTMDTDYSVH